MQPDATPEELALLEQDDPELASHIEDEREALRRAEWPRPELADVMTFYSRIRQVWASNRAQLEVNRAVRYLRDESPEKLRKKLEGEFRVRTRLSHNEVLRVTAAQARGKLKVTQLPAGSDPAAIDKAKKQERWLQAFWPAMERRSPLGLRRRWIDSMNGDGMGCYEVYLTGAYEDRVDFEHGPDEDEDQYLERTENDMLKLGEAASIGVRFRDAAMVFVELCDDDYSTSSHGVRRVIIAEKKNYRDVYVEQAKKLGIKKLEEARLPKPGDQGWPADISGYGGWSRDFESGSGYYGMDSDGDVEYITYYDGYWVQQIVGGVVTLDAPHGMPGCPVFPGFCIVTGSSQLAEAVQGITWGMIDIELLANEMLTHKLDVTLTYDRPAPVAVATDVNAKRPETRTGQERPIDLSDPERVRYAQPGWEIKDAFEGFRSRIQSNDVAEMVQLWERNGMNPILAGQSPGSDASGYQTNLLSGAAMTPYEGGVEAEERVLGQLLDFVRLIIRDTTKEREFLSVPMEDRKIGGVEWLGLGPQDIDETPCQVKINTTSDANRQAKTEWLHQGVERGYLDPERVQVEGYEIEDPESENIRIIEATLIRRLMPLLMEEAMNRVRIPQPGAAPGAPGQPTQAPPGSPGAAPPEGPPPPPGGMDAETAGASQGYVQKALAGQSNGYSPVPGQNVPGAQVQA